ncbi:MAG: winged helix-turn-helix domain-containing protein [Spirochaetia bacterium]|nr:winged helix-turn-helix domain-containing protein [Spirochaetia bacterium]
MENIGPEFLRFAIPIIEVLKENNYEGRPKDITDLVIKRCNISEDDLGEKLIHGGNRIKNQVHWARFYLMKAGYIDANKKGIWALTEHAKDTILRPEEVYPLFKDVRKNWQKKSDIENGDETPEEIEETSKTEVINFHEFFKSVDIDKYLNHKLNYSPKNRPQAKVDFYSGKE